MYGCVLCYAMWTQPVIKCMLQWSTGTVYIQYIHVHVIQPIVLHGRASFVPITTFCCLFCTPIHYLLITALWGVCVWNSCYGDYVSENVHVHVTCVHVHVTCVHVHVQCTCIYMFICV